MKNATTLRQYRESNIACEICPLIKDLVPFRCDGNRGVQLHHCWPGQRWDVVPGIIMVCNASHPDWIHSHSREALIACLLVKARKGEYDREMMHRISGRWVEGMVANYIEDGGTLEGFELLGREFLEAVK